MDESVYSNRIEKFLLKTLYHALRHYGRYILPNDDKSYIKLLYWCRPHEKLNLDSPKTFTEKVQCLKFYNRQPICTKMVDKYEAREIVREKIGEEYLIPLLGVWDNFDEPKIRNYHPIHD